tara:strand:- start:45 stop:179 length:135 start_codon:yes stop_codon:yes gene_type:complete
MQDCKRASNDRRSSDRRIQTVSVEFDRRKNNRRSGLDRRLIAKS